MDSRRSSAVCVKFIPNKFNGNRCQSCFRSRNTHSEEALQANKMSRKVVKCGFLYIAPEGVDFSNTAQRTKRWQRRWFALYDDGELSYALDQHTDTVPQGVVDMTICAEVAEAECLTGHKYSLRIATETNENYYIKADVADDIKRWHDILCIYTKQLTRRAIKGNMPNNDVKDSLNPTSIDNKIENGGPTLVQVKNLPFRDRGQRRTSDPLSQAKVDVARSNDPSVHGTPRSIKHRRTSRRDEMRSKTFSEFDTSGIIENMDSTNANAPSIDSDDGDKRNRVDNGISIGTNGFHVAEGRDCDISVPRVNGASSRSADREPNDHVMQESTKSTLENDVILTLSRCNGITDTNHLKENSPTLMHTLRKGWLMLKGRSDNEWTKHWVVLTGLSLKMYRDAWAEDDTSEASVQIDLTDCESVYPLAAARNYGIEIKCKRSRHILSALTPGIRDSWIAAIQQNLAVSGSAERNNDHLSFSNGNHRNDQPKKKRIAYVAPESHRCDLNCEMENDDGEDEDIESCRSSSRTDEVSLSERSLENGHDFRSDGDETATCSGASTPRRRSLSPTVRRSPVSRVKERDIRRRRSPAQYGARNSTNQPDISSSGRSHGPVSVQSEVIFDARNLSSEGARTEANVIAMLQSRLETIRQELERTRNRLSETESENERLRISTTLQRDLPQQIPRYDTGATSNNVDVSASELDRLRRTLQEAERDIWNKQEEIEILTRKLDLSVNELSDTETVLSTGLQDLDNDKVKVSTLSERWSRRVSAMEKQLRETIRRLDERERELACDRSLDQQRINDQQQRRRVSVNGSEKEDEVMTNLKAKLTESESKVAILTQKLQYIQNGITDQSSTASMDGVDSSKGAVSNGNDENATVLASLRHYCHDQNRRLLATLRNETEFLQTMVETKLSTISNSATSSAVELKELLDDLVAIHQYISDIDCHLPPMEASSPNEFMKDFNFKDVLNRLVEVQERIALLSKRDDAISTAECGHLKRLSLPNDAHTNLAAEVAELEQELLEIQAFHNDEIESLRSSHVVELETLRKELTLEQERRRKLYSDIETMKEVTDHSLAALERAHSQLIEQLRDEHHRELQRLEKEHEEALVEEKEATRQALDALQKAHESELHRQAEKLKGTFGRQSFVDENCNGGQISRYELQKALQDASHELSELSAAYSTKCVENSRMEDELEEARKLLEQMASGKLLDDQALQQLSANLHSSDRMAALQLQLNVKEAEILSYQHRLRQLESDLVQTRNTLAVIMQSKNDVVESTVKSAVLPESSPAPVLNGHQKQSSSSSASSDEQDAGDDEDDIAAEYQPKVTRRRREFGSNRRADSRYHSTPNLGAEPIGNLAVENTSQAQSGHGLTPDQILQELRNVMGLPVSERRKYFEDLCKPVL